MGGNGDAARNVDASSKEWGKAAYKRSFGQGRQACLDYACVRSFMRRIQFQRKACICTIQPIVSAMTNVTSCCHQHISMSIVRYDVESLHTVQALPCSSCNVSSHESSTTTPPAALSQQLKTAHPMRTYRVSMRSLPHTSETSSPRPAFL